MASEYKDIKEQVSELVSDLENINKEATTLQDTNRTLGEIAGTMLSLSSELRNVVEQSNSVYEYVNDVAVKKTLDSFNASAEAFEEKANQLISEIDARQEKLSAENTARLDALSENVKKSSESLLEQAADKYAALQAEINKKFWMMGGVSVAAAIVAVILALVC